MINIVLYQPEISPNTGNIIRTCFALGARLHIIKPIAFDLHPHWLKRPAAGRLLSDIEHEVHENYHAFEKKYGHNKIYYLTRYGYINYSDINFADKKPEEEIFLFFGTESTGIPKYILQKSLDTCLRIPMTAQSRSINLANAVVVLGYEVSKQLGFAGLAKYETQKGKDFIIKNE
ncbi:tRNA (cytidine(34)-2'-O)-methyltransferase [Mycoplasma iguanae]|uniref:Putative tRNA (cytidine(34)-2'-O)-methyltransferase n=1 Tax=Mycoplasma iguanae TaxID=292461 RepID=A0ABY5R7K0_9MOLU|nr:tRNA (cytidine(34)-2'-O)-methyltransferase [Mycoplasma iguanae]UVD81486.1 tRNA (cytidine(34)-2'-O)-methyltransferase [Mycoplasma iguanae]